MTILGTAEMVMDSNKSDHLDWFVSVGGLSLIS